MPAPRKSRPPYLFFVVIGVPLLMLLAYVILNTSLDTAPEAAAARPSAQAQP